MALLRFRFALRFGARFARTSVLASVLLSGSSHSSSEPKAANLLPLFADAIEAHALLAVVYYRWGNISSLLSLRSVCLDFVVALPQWHVSFSDAKLRAFGEYNGFRAKKWYTKTSDPPPWLQSFHAGAAAALTSLGCGPSWPISSLALPFTTGKKGSFHICPQPACSNVSRPSTPIPSIGPKAPMPMWHARLYRKCGQHGHWLLVPWRGLRHLKLEASHADYKD